MLVSENHYCIWEESKSLYLFQCLFTYSLSLWKDELLQMSEKNPVYTGEWRYA
jgi:hypothetical protein